MNYGGLSNQGSYGESAPAVMKQVTIRQELEGNIKYLEEQLSKKKQLLELLKENPAIEQFMDLSRG